MAPNHITKKEFKKIKVGDTVRIREYSGRVIERVVTEKHEERVAFDGDGGYPYKRIIGVVEQEPQKLK
jgi:hypothetical protein